MDKVEFKFNPNSSLNEQQQRVSVDLMNLAIHIRNMDEASGGNLELDFHGKVYKARELSYSFYKASSNENCINDFIAAGKEIEEELQLLDNPETKQEECKKSIEHNNFDDFNLYTMRAIQSLANYE